MFGRIENEVGIRPRKKRNQTEKTPYQGGLERAVRFAVKWNVLEVDHLTLLGIIPDTAAWTGGNLGGGLVSLYWTQYQRQFGEKHLGRNLWRFLGQPASTTIMKVIPQRGMAWRENIIRSVAKELNLPLHKVHGEKDFTIGAGLKEASLEFKGALGLPQNDERRWELLESIQNHKISRTQQRGEKNMQAKIDVGKCREKKQCKIISLSEARCKVCGKESYGSINGGRFCKACGEACDEAKPAKVGEDFKPMYSSIEIAKTLGLSLDEVNEMAQSMLGLDGDTFEPLAGCH